jgi:hypothetical protein
MNTGPVLANNPAPAPSSPNGAMAGFDTCTAPSLPTMKAWRAKYSATAIYIGGQMMGCGQANLSASWVQLQAQGYVSGVYSSADAAIIDLQSTTTIAGHSLAEPQAIWFALWDNASNLTGSPYMTTAVWPVASRSKQLAGNRVVSVGGISLDIDTDLVASAVAHG